MKVQAKCPTRVDIAGGTLDIWPISQCIKGATTVNVGVDLFATTVIEYDPDPSRDFVIESQDLNISISGPYEKIIKEDKLGLHCKALESFWERDFGCIKIKTHALSPAGAGLGGSSSLAISMLGAINFLRNRLFDKPLLDKRGLVGLAQNIEAQLIHSPTGCQDYWGAINGGLNLIEHLPPGTKVQTHSPDHLKDHLILCYCGVSRFSGINNWQVFRRFFESDSKVLGGLEKIALWSQRCFEALMHGNLEGAIECSKNEWLVRKSMWPEIETKETKAIDSAAIESGAKFTRVCGAGGGGVMAIFAEKSCHNRINAAVEAAGGEVLASKVSNGGLEVDFFGS